jgi:hypothetical protein
MTIQTNAKLDGDTLIVERTEDVGGALDAIHELRADGLGKGKDGWHLASFPPIIVEQYCNANKITLYEWFSNPDHVNRMLNDSALSAFRVVGGSA